MSSASCFRWIVQTTWCMCVRLHKLVVQEGYEQRCFFTSTGAVGLTSNGVTSSPTQNGAAPAASQSVDPQLVSLLQKVASGGLQPETAARHLRELGAGYQQVMDFAQVCSHPGGRAYRLSACWQLYYCTSDHNLCLTSLSTSPQQQMPFQTVLRSAATYSWILSTLSCQ